MKINRHTLEDTRGAALVTALIMLGVFSVFGFAFVKYMAVEFDKTKLDVDKIRAQHLSDGGIYAAISELQETQSVEKAYTFKLNAYRYVKDEGSASRELTPFLHEVHVEVKDQSGKININHASSAVLKAMGFSQEATNKIKKGTEKQAFVRVDDLIARKIINTKTFVAINAQDNFTVYGNGNINLNAASPAVLAALFALTPKEATALAAKRPFTSWEDVLTKAAKESWTFNVPTRVEAGQQTPEGLSLDSGCFALTSKVRMNLSSNELKKTTDSTTEAIVSFDTKGNSSIQYWRESSARINSDEVEKAKETENEASAPEEDAEE